MKTYESPGLTRDEADRLALALLEVFDGTSVCAVRHVLRRMEFWLDAVTELDCGAATEYERAVEGLPRDSV